MASDPLLVFLPGTLCDEQLWKYQTAVFPNHRVVSLRHQSSIPEMIDSVSAVEARSFVLIGFSMGGHIAQEFAIRFPERVEKLVIIAASSEGYPPEEKRKVSASLELIRRGTFTGISDRRLRDFLHPKAYANEEVRRTIHGMSGNDAKEVYLRQLEATLDRPHLLASMKDLKMDVTFIAGREDQIVPLPSITRSQQNVPNAKIFVIEECGHFVPLEHPGQLNQLLLKLV